MPELTPAVRRYFSDIGSKKTHAKKESSRRNIMKAIDAKAAPTEQLEAAYKAVKSGKSTMTNAAVDPGKCSYYTLRDYVRHREAGATPEQARQSPKRRTT